MKYLITFIVLLFAIAFGYLGCSLGLLFGALVQYMFDLNTNIISYICAVPFAVFFAVIGGSLVIAYIETTEFLSKKFAEFLVGVKEEDILNN